MHFFCFFFLNFPLLNADPDRRENECGSGSTGLVSLHVDMDTLWKVDRYHLPFTLFSDLTGINPTTRPQGRKFRSGSKSNRKKNQEGIQSATLVLFVIIKFSIADPDPPDSYNIPGSES